MANDIRNSLNVELARAKGSYVGVVPAGVIGDGFGGGAGTGWTAELKRDGQRASMEIGVEGSLFFSRSRHGKLKGVESAKGNDFVEMTAGVPHLSCVTSGVLAGTLLDGELEVPGRSSNYVTTALAHGGIYPETGQKLHYFVWDCLFFCGEDMRGQPLSVRRGLAWEAVEQLRAENPCLEISVVEFFPATQAQLDAWTAAGFEGGVLKHVNSTYKQGGDMRWWKAKAEKTIDAFIVAFSQARSGGSPKQGIKPQLIPCVAKALLGMYDSTAIVPVGWMSFPPADKPVMAGISLDEMWANQQNYVGRVVEVTVSGWTGSAFRWPRFKMFRDDKHAQDCIFTEQVGAVPAPDETEE